MVDQSNTRLLTAAEYRQLPETTQPMELIHGQVIMRPSPKSDHQEVSAQLFRVLDKLIQGGTLLYSPMDVYLDEHNVVQPDLFWVSPKGACHKIEGYWHGAPDLVIEILSPKTAVQDKRTKFHLYEENGVQEYWIVDPAADLVEVWTLSSDHLMLQDVYGKDHQFVSKVLGDKTVAVSDIFLLSP